MPFSTNQEAMCDSAHFADEPVGFFDMLEACFFHERLDGLRHQPHRLLGGL